MTSTFVQRSLLRVSRPQSPFPTIPTHHFIRPVSIHPTKCSPFFNHPRSFASRPPAAYAVDDLFAWEVADEAIGDSLPLSTTAAAFRHNLSMESQLSSAHTASKQQGQSFEYLKAMMDKQPLGKAAQSASEKFPPQIIQQAPYLTTLNSIERPIPHQHSGLDHAVQYNIDYGMYSNPVFAQQAAASGLTSAGQFSMSHHTNPGVPLSGVKIINTAELDHLWGPQRHDIMYQTTHLYNSNMTRHLNGEVQTGVGTKATEAASRMSSSDPSIIPTA